MYEYILPKVLQAYGVEPAWIFDSQKGYRNEIWPVMTIGDQMINVTFYKREAGILERIKRADAVSEYLNKRGMPTKTRYDERTLVIKNGALDTKVAVYNYLAGDTIPWEAYTMTHIKALGAGMSNMHALLTEFDASSLPSVYDEYLLIISRMRTYFDRPEVAEAMTRKVGIKVDLGRLDIYEKVLEKYSNLPGQQALHMDFVRGNILFDGSEISGVLDFEKTALGHSIMDIARTLAFLLVDCKYKTEDKVSKYFLQSGYIKRGANQNVGDDDDRVKFVEMFLLYDFYKFLLHNPYESLCQNEHYVRTKDILQRYGVVSLNQ